MYKLTKQDIEMYVQSIRQAYPYAPDEAFVSMRKRFAEMDLNENLLMESRKNMDVLNTAILLNVLSRAHITEDDAMWVARYFPSEQLQSQLHATYPDERMEEMCQIINTWKENCIAVSNYMQKEKSVLSHWKELKAIYKTRDRNTFESTMRLIAVPA